MKRVFSPRSALETQALGEALARELGVGDLVALYGPLGAGKTTFVRGLARGLGWRGRVRSPSFTLVNRYPGEVPLWHYDLYRVEEVDLTLLDLEVALSEGVAAVEWAERALWLPVPRWEVRLSHLDEGRLVEVVFLATTM